MVILNTLRTFLAEHGIDGPLVVAVSGGTDSTALLLAFAELGAIAFEAAHVNHHLRGAESDADELFVRELCARHDVPLHILDGTLDRDAIRRGGIEEAARRIRYARLKELGMPVATAHQKNDQAETVLMRLITGGGLAGLRGIHPVRADGIIRPLLEVPRSATEAFLAARGIRARADRSNSDPRFLRNRARAALATLDATAIDDLAAIASTARMQWARLEQAIDAADTSIATATETRFARLPDDRWLRRALLHRHIQRLDAEARVVTAAALERLAGGSEKRLTVTKSVELLRNGDEVVLRRTDGAHPPSAPFEIEMRAGESRFVPQIGRTIAIRRPPAGRGQLFRLPVGADAVFTIRNRREGDRFQPLGMSKPKKLKDFLIDRKIAAELRDRIPLVVWNGHIVWVAGVEISEAFKVIDGAGELCEASIDEEDQEGVQREGDRQPDR